jgi:hypothetical protein
MENERSIIIAKAAQKLLLRWAWPIDARSKEEFDKLVDLADVLVKDDEHLIKLVARTYAFKYAATLKLKDKPNL